MITSLSISNFRGLKQVTLSGLRSVNLIVGGNNTGKTSVLEALVLLLGDSATIGNLPGTFRSTAYGNSARNDVDDREHFWSWLFPDRDIENPIGIEASLNNASVLSVESKRSPAEGYNDGRMETNVGRWDFRGSDNIRIIGGKAISQAIFLFKITGTDLKIGGADAPAEFRLSVLSTRPTSPDRDADYYNQVSLLADGEKRVEKLMQKIEPRLNRLRYARQPNTNTHLVFADVGLSRAVPVSQMGQAFNRILHIYTHILAHRINVLLVDEIENGIFCDAMPEVWRGLLAICEQENVQIFATTHSRECVMAAQAIAHERGKDELCVQRLQLVNDQVEAARLGGEQLELAAEMNLEVRS